MRKYLVSAIAAVSVVAATSSAQADMAAANKWIESEFQPSTLSKSEQAAEMEWFVNVATPFKGMEINVLSEGIPTHSYESEVLTKAFEEITGIKVNHQILGEGEVVQAAHQQNGASSCFRSAILPALFSRWAIRHTSGGGTRALPV